MIFESSCKIELIRENKMYLAHFALGMSSFSSLDQLVSTLSNRELQELRTQRHDKRRLEYSLGRYVAKKSVLPFLLDKKTNDISIVSGVFKQPVLYYPNHMERIQVSLSHANHVAVSIAFPEEHPMAIDIEHISENNEEALRRQMLEKEIQIVHSLDLQLHTGLTLLWTVKESISKVLKTGLTVPLTLFAVSKVEQVEGGYISEFDHFLQYKAFSWILDSYICTICLPRNTSFIIDMEKVSCLPNCFAN